MKIVHVASAPRTKTLVVSETPRERVRERGVCVGQGREMCVSVQAGGGHEGEGLC